MFAANAQGSHRESRFAINFVCVVLLAIMGSQVYAQDDSAVGPVMKLFKSGRLPPERQGTVVEMICSRGNANDLRVIYDQLIAPESFSVELRSQALDWLAVAATTRKIIPRGDLEAVVPLTKAADKRLQLAAIRLTAAWKLNSASTSLQSIASNKTVPAEIQRAAIEGLVAIGGTDSQATLLALTEREQPLAVRVLAVAGLVSLDLQVACQQAAALVADAQATDNLNPMFNAFFDRKDGTDALAASLKTAKISQDVAKTALRYMYSVGRSDPALSTVLSEVAGVASDPPPPTQEEVAALAEEVAAKGDAARGEMIFRRNDLSCLRCHAINRAGGQIGPDLSAVGGSSPLDYIINSILNPNLAVKEQYVTKIFVLESGKVLTGVVVDRDDNRVVVRDAQGKIVTMASVDIEEEAEGKSMMPQGLTKFLTHEETLDLAKFIAELGKPGAYAIRKTPVVQRWRVMNNPPPELIAGVPHLEHIRQLILSSQPEQWTSVYSQVSGSLPLDELRTSSAPVVVILQAELQVHEPGELEFKLATNAVSQLWLDDQAFDSQQSFSSKLPSGRHALTLRIEIADQAAPEVMLEIVKPGDSSVQFEIVGGT